MDARKIYLTFAISNEETYLNKTKFRYFKFHIEIGRVRMSHPI
jgi:hypothetical protein